MYMKIVGEGEDDLPRCRFLQLLAAPVPKCCKPKVRQAVNKRLAGCFAGVGFSGRCVAGAVVHKWGGRCKQRRRRRACS